MNNTTSNNLTYQQDKVIKYKFAIEVLGYLKDLLKFKYFEEDGMFGISGKTAKEVTFTSINETIAKYKSKLEVTEGKVEELQKMLLLEVRIKELENKLQSPF
jgi:hypothetical protein